MQQQHPAVLAIIGGQYGSEGKGNIVKYLAQQYDVHVRVGGPNAGHSFKHQGRTWAMQSVPCGWINPKATLIIGAGALVDPKLLVQELDAIAEVDPTIYERVRVDLGAGIIGHQHHAEEGGTQGELHARIGSTGEGVGAARLDRIRRNPDHFKRMRDVAFDHTLGNGWALQSILLDTAQWLHQARQANSRILLEGAQGFGLSLIHGHWPYVTSNDTNAAQFAADVGLPPHAVTEVGLVIRTYPIRVGGNSGPIADEISWEELSARVGRPVLEHTTVTKKVRRVAEFNPRLVEHAIRVNGPHWLALNFLDYVSPEDEGKTRWDDLSEKGRVVVRQIEQEFDLPVLFVGTGGPEWSIVEVPHVSARD